MAKMSVDKVDSAEAAVAELLAAIEDARERAALAYEFNSGCAYAYAAAVACEKAARLAGVPSKKSC
jgi:hypothetical protein